MDFYLTIITNNVMLTLSEVYVFSTNHKYICYFITCILFLVLNLIFYNILYKSLDLDRTISSFMWFTAFIIILLIYVRGLSYLYVSYNNIKPIYLNTLPLLSSYKYVLFSIFVIVFGLLWCISLYFNSISQILNILQYPYLKKEIRRILYVWNNTFWGVFCSFLIKKIASNITFKRCFFVCHFIIFYITRFITCSLLLNFAFFSGNISLLIYWLPVSFAVWLLGFFDYYFKIFREGSLNFIKEILGVTYNNELTKENSSVGYIKSTLDQFTFTLLPPAFEEGFTYSDVDFLANKWHNLVNLDYIFNRYDDFVIMSRRILIFFVVYVGL